jgi:2,3-bisphosphoglycerate-independent phosphoglycerate mutase
VLTTGNDEQVGHTGVYEAAVKAISETDKAVKTIYEACQEAGYILLITADHGNAEQMINPDTGNPHTAHTTNPVPFIMTADPKKYSFVQDAESHEEGALCDVAPTVLTLMVSCLLFLTLTVGLVLTLSGVFVCVGP